MTGNVLKKWWAAGGVLLSLAAVGFALAANGVDLGASPEVAGTAEGQIMQPRQQARMALNYVNQPPLIPHGVDGYQITRNTNRCLQCHDIAHYRNTGAPRISPTHFMDSDGKMLGEVAPRRYFCLQCHVTQTDAAPIVGNTFEPLPGFGK
ncbi:nitrate reductase [Gibbsiella quercinecans]|uniref:nitrate reductase cytochrome c-type subunit n=1 Tax=Gibbsiella quercinecans TaxID=929813 RepID=UPI000EF24949|nr:nitrate reductase cytochrome c-type subunit [Gibbsiella quercinecans]RLM13617.1 nitrate reductase [Gibbsiella quercinecans]